MSKKAFEKCCFYFINEPFFDILDFGTFGKLDIPQLSLRYIEKVFNYIFIPNIDGYISVKMGIFGEMYFGEKYDFFLFGQMCFGEMNFR